MAPIYQALVSPDGKKQCVIESDTESVWAYLLDLSTRRIVADVPVCSICPVKKLHDLRSEVLSGNAPPLVEEYSSPRAVVAGLSAERLAVRWPSGEESVIILLDDEPFALMRSGEKRGYSKATKRDGPWGKPWDESLIQKKIANQSPESTAFGRSSS